MKIKVLFLFTILTGIAIVLFSVSYNQTWENEPNNNPLQATILGSLGDYLCGFQDFDTSLWGDDYYVFSASAGQTVNVVGDANFPTDIGLIITNMSDFYLVGPIDSRGAGLDEYINGFVVPSNGDYCVVAYEANKMKGSGYTYSLQVTISELPTSVNDIWEVYE